MAKKTAVRKAEAFTWVKRPHPLGLKLAYEEAVGPLPKPGQITLPPPSSSIPPTLPVVKPVQERPVTQVVTIIPKVTLPPSSGRGNAALNIDGYRMINLFVVADAVLSTAERGIAVDIAFAPATTVENGWTNLSCDGTDLYNFDSLGLSAGDEARYFRLAVSDRNVNDRVKAGGRDLTYIVRVPVLGPFIRVSVTNRDTTPRTAEVTAYLVS